MIELKDIKIPNENQAPITKKDNKIKAGFMAYLPSALLTLILVFLSGLGALIQFDFNFKTVVWSVLGISIALRLISNFLSKYVGSNLYYNKSLYSEDVQRYKKEFIEESQSINKSELEDYVCNYNLELKKNAYIQKINNKIIPKNNKIERLNYKNKLSFSKHREKKILKLKQTVQLLKDKIAEDYILENLKFLKVKYKKIKSCYFISPIDEIEESNVQYTVTFSKENSKEILKSLPLTIALIFFGAVIGYDAYFGNINAIAILYDISNMIFNFILGWFIVGKKITSKTISSYINRLMFLSKFKSVAEATTGKNQNHEPSVKEDFASVKTANNGLEIKEQTSIQNESVN